MAASTTVRIALLAVALCVATFVRAEHPPSDERDRYRSEDRSRYDDRNRDWEDPRYDEDSRYDEGRSLHDDVHDAIESALGADADRIAVSVRGRQVTLSGSVRDGRARRIAHDVAHDVPGVRSVSMRALYVRNRR
jgi:hypothetical protein